MKNCNIVMEKYLSLDKGERIPLLITAHLFICKHCRNEVRFLRKAEVAAASNAQVGIKDESIAAVMKKIYASDKSQKNPISLSKWIICGIALAVFFLAFAIFARRINSSGLKLFTYIELSVVLTVYCVFFIRSNMDFFVKIISAKISNASFQED